MDKIEKLGNSGDGDMLDKTANAVEHKEGFDNVVSLDCVDVILVAKHM